MSLLVSSVAIFRDVDAVVIGVIASGIIDVVIVVIVVVVTGVPIVKDAGVAVAVVSAVGAVTVIGDGDGAADDSCDVDVGMAF